MRIALVSTPRSGNTWLRKLLSELYELDSHAIHRPDELLWSELSTDCIVQIHWHAEEDFISRLEEHEFKYVTISRHPLDVLLSILHFCRHEPETALWLDGDGGDESSILKASPSSLDFRNYITSERARALLSITPEWADLSESVVIRYERLVHSPTEELDLVAEQFGGFRKSIEEVLENSSEERLRSLSNNHHYWQGKPGLWTELLSKTTVKETYEFHKKVFESLGYAKPSNFASEADSASRWKKLCIEPDISKFNPTTERFIPVSYAQNFEDVILWRALKKIEKGFYIDVGANDPIQYSVTKAFYDAGWRGINIEPVSEWYEKIREERPEDVNLQLAVGASEDGLNFFEVVGTGLSTTNESIAKRHAQNGFEIINTKVPTTSLTHICKQHAQADIHFLKIDVEGSELTALQGIDLTKFRPWIILVESTLPLSRHENYKKWEEILLSSDYLFAYFDGLNRFYVSKEHHELLTSFSTPPNVFDCFRGAKEVELQQDFNQQNQKFKKLSNEFAETNEKLEQANACLKQTELHLLESQGNANQLEKSLQECEGKYILLGNNYNDLKERNDCNYNETIRLSRLIYSARITQHLYRAWQVLIGNAHYKRKGHKS
jgi:FkbM family methyltransferase